MLAWLEQASVDKYASDKRLDPFATSMRDFDDVSEDLRRLRNNLLPAKNDPPQRITDLRGAKLVDASITALSPLGQSTLLGWERHGVANSDIHDELARHLILLSEAVKASDPLYLSFLDYWFELRDRFSPFDLIDRWDALYTLNYLDHKRRGYRPGDHYHQEAEPIDELEFDLDDVAADNDGGNQAISGANRIKRAIEGKVPRGRHRATFCSALEVIAGGNDSFDIVVEHFGVPEQPRDWSTFDEDHKVTIRQIVEGYGLLEPTTKKDLDDYAGLDFLVQEQVEYIESVLDADDSVDEAPVDDQQLILPENFAFQEAVVDLPKIRPSQPTVEGQEHAKKESKTDYIKKASVNKMIGDWGEEFAISFERWRLRDQPLLQEKIRHVSKEDDSAGYDIFSFESDGSPRLVEVKSTSGALDRPFFISARELETAEENKDKYVILRVFDLRDTPKCCEIRFPFKEVINLSPSTYLATFVQK